MGYSAGNPRLPRTNQLPNCTRPTCNGHQNSFSGPANFWPRTMTPLQIGRDQPHPASDPPTRQLRTTHHTIQNLTQPFSRNLTQQTQRPTDALMMDGDIQQSEPTPEACSQPLRPQASLQPVEKLLGTQRCKLIDADLIDVDD
ncbi:MAG TPA: hypothetical protein VIP98_18315, partial [Microlunatus sp.]